MRRWCCLAVLFGLLAVLFSAVPASAEDSCAEDFEARLRCWTEGIEDRTVAVTLDRQLPFGDIPLSVLDDRHNIEVRVPAGQTTGAGGTALLALADHRYVHPRARITRLSKQQVEALEELRVCRRQADDLCDLVGPKPGAGTQVSGKDLISEQGVGALPRTEYSLGSSGGSDRDYKDWLLIGMSVLLALLLAAFVLAVRRTRTVAVAAPALGIREAERTTRLRATPTHRAPAPAPVPAPRPGPSRSAVVRTDLHPQGYVELDRVLYRAVWAEPGQPPPPPGSRVDVADAPEPDSDLLYAFPPAAGRHAHAR